MALQFSLDYPDRIKGLILIASGGYPAKSKPGILSLNRYEIPGAIIMSFSSYPFVMRSTLKSMYYDPSAISEEVVQELCAIYRTPNSRQAMYWMPRALNWDFAIADPKRIPTISAPTLIIWGREDMVVHPDTALRFHQDIDHSTLVLIDEAGHMVHEEQPEQVNRAILDFSSRIQY